MKKYCVLLVVLVSLAFVGFGEGESSEGGEEIKIGVAGPSSGDLASYGIPTMRAAALVVEEVNAAGGVNGSMITLVVEDDQCKPEVAANVAAKLVGEEVVAVIGHICSGATEAALSTYLSSGIVAISPSATNPPLTKSGNYPNFFRTIAPDDAQAERQVKFVVEDLGLNSFAVLHDTAAYGKGLAEFAQTTIENTGGAEVVLFDGVTPGAIDYSAIINRIAVSDADVVVFGGYHPEASKLVDQMKNLNVDITFISGDGVKDDSFIKVAGAASEGVYATGPIDASSNPITIKAKGMHQAKYGEDPGPFFNEAFAATLALLNAIDSANSTEYEAIRTALMSETVDTSVGSISFDDSGDASGVGFAVYQVQNGSYVEVQ